VVLQLSAGLRARGHDTQVVAVLTPGAERDHPFVLALRDLKIPVHVLLVGGRAYLEERREVVRLAQKLGSQVLHTHGYRADILHGASARAAGARHLMTLHGFVSGTWRDRLYEWLQVRAARTADAVIAVSKPIEQRLKAAHIFSNVHVLRNAIGPVDGLSRDSARDRLALPAEVPVVGWVGRLNEEKGPDLFVRALAAAPSQLHGIMVGDGPMREKVAALAASLGMTGRLHMAGNVAGASRYFSAFDALAMTSRTEGTPMVMLEAMQAGVPVVTTMVGGIPDIVGDKEAWCCDPADLGALARAMDGAVNDKTGRERRVASAMELVVTRFDLASWIEKHEQLYRLPNS
jgi:glycosyltransferase involved in cell wall biosynthesis